MYVVLVLGLSWMDLIIVFLSDDILSNEAKEAKNIRRISGWFCLCRDRRLYRWLFGGSYLLCFRLKKVDSFLAAKNAKRCYVKKCDQCHYGLFYYSCYRLFYEMGQS